MHLKLSSAKWRPFPLGLNVLIHVLFITMMSCKRDSASFSEEQAWYAWNKTANITAMNDYVKTEKVK